MKNILLTIVIFLFSNALFGQFNDIACPARKNDNSFIAKSGCIQQSSISNDYYRRYNYYRDLYSNHNSMVIYVNIFVWQKNDGSGNYTDNLTNRNRLAEVLGYADYFYNHNVSPSFQPTPAVDYDSTKIRFVLKNIYFEKDNSCWSKGLNIGGDGLFLNGKADNLRPSEKNIFKIHITCGDTIAYSGFAPFPSTTSYNEHYIVTLNTKRDQNNQYYHLSTVDPDGLWAFGQHIAHEFGHNFDLDHTYCYQNGVICSSYYLCSENDADYLDDVFGTTLNNSKRCPQPASWGCDPYATGSTCTNNMMGGTSSARYFSPKQIQRMHRALSLLSIRNYAVAYNFDDTKYIDITQNETWDFSIKMYNNLRVKSGTTLTIQCEVQFVPEAKVIIEPGGKLIIDGGKLTNERYYNTFWQGIEVYGTSNQHQYPSNNPTYQGMLIVKNGGIIENAHIGATNWKKDDYAKIGGVIQANGGIFRNNRRDVVFVNYDFSSNLS